MTAVADTIRNGIDTATLFGTLDLLKEQPELGRFVFRAHNHWVEGAHNRSTIKGFYAAGGRTPRAPRPSRSTPASRRSCSAPTRARTPPSTCCTRSPPV